MMPSLSLSLSLEAIHTACVVRKPLPSINTVGWVLNVRFFWLQIVSFYKRRNQKNMQWIIFHVLRPFRSSLHAAIANMHALSISHVFDILACMYVQLSIVKNESSSILQANCRPANTEPSATVTRRVWYSINSPPHMQPLKPHLYS